MESTVAVYTHALERVLGAPTASLHLVDIETLKEWFVSPQTNNGHSKSQNAEFAQVEGGAELKELRR
jgi:hypothetical protein